MAAGSWVALPPGSRRFRPVRVLQRRRPPGAGVCVLGWLLPLLIPALLQGQTDTLTRDQLRRSGRTTLSEVIAELVPSFNVPQPSNTGASDALRSATLHAMGADQLVVLIDGRPRLQSALLNLSESTGRGQNSVDLDAIPLSAIERIEVLRHGDAARYGFGAVAGVINIVLLERAPLAAEAMVGTRSAGDGKVLFAGGHHFLRLPKGGYLQLGAELRSQASTNRALPDPRQQYFNGDSRNTDPGFSNRVDQRFGQPEANELKGVLSGVQPISGGITAYGVATWSRKSAESAELWRPANDDRTVRALYPNGFLPLSAPKLYDGSALGGARGRALGFGWDASVGYARNSVQYDLERTANASLGRLSPTRFDAGALRADQFQFGLELTRRIGFRGSLPPVSLSLGAQHRSDGYAIEAGEPDSWRYGAVPIQDGPHAGNLAQPGAQGFPGFRPNNAVVARRGMAAGYGTLSTLLLKRVSLAAAGRVERYPHLGTLGVFQLSGEMDGLHGFGIRGYHGTGVRVPTLAQTAYSSSSTFIASGFGFEQRTLAIRDTIARILGVQPLRPEWSQHSGVGGSWSGGGLRLGVDYFSVTVRNQIILTGDFTDFAVQAFLAQQHFPNVGSLRFFANALRSRTRGVDASAEYRARVGTVGFQLGGSFAHATTRVALTDSVTGVLTPFTSVFFTRGERARLEQGQPVDNLLLRAEAQRGPWTLRVRSERYGSVASAGVSPDGTQDQRYGAKWLADLSARYQGRALALQVGADNVFGTYPDHNRFGDVNSEGNSNFGMFPYSNLSPFGFTGRFVYLRAEWR